MKYWQRWIFFPKWGDRFLTLGASLLLIAATFSRVFAQDISVESGIGTVLGTPANASTSISFTMDAGYSLESIIQQQTLRIRPMPRIFCTAITPPARGLTGC